MYEHVREIVCGLILSLVFMAITAVVAVVDPWSNGVPWANWAAISVVAVFSVSTATVCMIESDNENDIWILNMFSLVGWLMVAGFSIAMATTQEEGGLDPAYHSLAWSIFAVPFVVLPVTTMVQYLAGAVSARRAQRRGNQYLRRVA